MTKTARVNIVLLLLALPFSALRSEEMEKTEKDLAEKVNKACDSNITVNLHDYTYGRDEGRLYSNNHFEDASILTYQMAEGCRINSANKTKLSRVRTVFIKRGSLGERKLIQRKDGDLVYLANRVKAEQSRDKRDVIEDDLVRVLKFTTEKEADIKAAAAKEAEKVAEKKRDEDREKKTADRQKKIDELTAWFQAEVKKITVTPDANMAPKLEKLTKTYEEKLNALTNTP